MAGATRDLGNGEYAANTIDTSSQFYDGTTTATSAAAVVLGPEARCVEVLIQSDPENTAGVRVGNATSQSHYLEPGGLRSVPATDVSLIYVRAILGSQRINWWARGA